MRRVIMPPEEQARQAATQRQNLPLIPASPERTMDKRIETVTEAAASERTKTERTQTLVTETQADVVPTSKAALKSTPMPNPAIATASQDILATPSTAKTLLLLTIGPRFDRVATEAGFESSKSSAGHTEKLPYEEPSTADFLLNAAKVQMDLILSN